MESQDLGIGSTVCMQKLLKQYEQLLGLSYGRFILSQAIIQKQTSQDGREAIVLRGIHELRFLESFKGVSMCTQLKLGHCKVDAIQWEEKREESKDKKLHLDGDNISVGHRIGAHIAFIRALSLEER